MLTSYYAKTKTLLESGHTNLVAISGYCPDFFLKQMQSDNRLSRCVELAPKKEWFFKWKKGEINNEKFVELYKKTVLEKIDFEELLEKIGDDAVFLCYEKPEDFCHRHILADYLKEKFDITVEEIIF